MGLNHYSTLGIRVDATEVEIKKAYRRLSKQYHPDANPKNKEAVKKFREITESYAVLQDPEKRAAYDRGSQTRKAGGGDERRGRTEKPRSGVDTDTADIDLGDISRSFEQFFGFHPKNEHMDEKMLNKNGKTKTNPLEMTEMFEKYMGIKKK